MLGGCKQTRIEIDSLITLTGPFKSVVDGTPVNPTNVFLFIVDPNKQTQSHQYPGDIDHNADGIFSYDLVPTVPGWWTYVWQGTGAVIATSGDQKFYVEPSLLIPAS